VIAIVVAFNLFVLFFIPILWFMDSNFYRSLSKENLFLYCILEIWFYKSFAFWMFQYSFLFQMYQYSFRRLNILTNHSGFAT
jgi:hypothetical protein